MNKKLTPIADAEIVGQPRTMSFPDAMRMIKEGKSVTRVSWGNKDYCLLKDGWLTIFTKDQFFVWKVNDGDIEGEDWVITLTCQN